MTTRILIVDYDPLHAKLLSFLLADAGYAASTLADSREADAAIRRDTIGLAIVEASSSRYDGFALCARLKRQHADLPVILISERCAPDVLVQGFAQGADDYIPRPYDPAELLARVQAVLRRYRRVERDRFGAELKVGETRLDLGTLAFTGASGRSTTVTPTEMRILECLMRNADAAMSREKLIVETWGYDAESADNRVDVYIRRLRRKIEAHPEDRDLIRTTRGVGYTFSSDRRSAGDPASGGPVQETRGLAAD